MRSSERVRKDKEQSRVVWMREYLSAGNNPQWATIEFEKWWKNDTKEVCVIVRAGRPGARRCSKICDYCKNNYLPF